MSLVHSVSFSSIGTFNGRKDKRLAILSETKESFSFLPVTLSSAKTKYPVCCECGTPVVWSKGSCRCGNLEEAKSTEYRVKSTGQTFRHTTWQA